MFCLVCIPEVRSRRHSRIALLSQHKADLCSIDNSSSQTPRTFQNEFRSSRRWFSELQAHAVSRSRTLHLFAFTTPLTEWIWKFGLELLLIYNLDHRPARGSFPLDHEGMPICRCRCTALIRETRTPGIRARTVD